MINKKLLEKLSSELHVKGVFISCSDEEKPYLIEHLEEIFDMEIQPSKYNTFSLDEMRFTPYPHSKLFQNILNYSDL